MSEYKKNQLVNYMEKRKLYIIGAGIGIIFVLLGILLGYYISKYKNTEQQWFAERDTRQRLEKQVAQLQSELSSTKQELSAKENMVKIYEQNLDSLKEKVAAISEEKKKLEAEKKEKEEKFKELREDLQKEIQAKEIIITELKGKLTVNLMDKVLFDSGKAKIKRTGLRVLDKIAKMLNKYPNRQVRVEGHTDNVPISSARYPTNWELSTARATSAVRYLQKRGVNPRRLVAVGYSKYHPIASNDTPNGRARNRRIEIILMPPEPEIRKEEMRLATD